MIITRLSGGLGNQMFQYAAGLALAERRRTVLKVDISWFRETTEWALHGRYALDAFNLSAHFATAGESERASGISLTRTERWSVAVARLLRFRQYAQRYGVRSTLCRPTSQRYFSDFSTLPDGTYLDGLFQSERFFDSYTDEVRRHFTPRYPLSTGAQRLLAQIQSGPSAFVHVRRGDYASTPRFRKELGVLDDHYYRNAVIRLRKQHPLATLYVFSDELDAVAQAPFLDGPVVFARTQPELTAVESLFLMSQCHHAIVANSTFSWWGAWLIPQPEKSVIAPTPWFAASPIDTTDLVPATWLREAASFIP